MITRVNAHPNGETAIRSRASDDVITIDLGTADEIEYLPSVQIYMPDSDEDALLVLQLLEAAIDNANSAVRLRQQKREAASA